MNKMSTILNWPSAGQPSYTARTQRGSGSDGGYSHIRQCSSLFTMFDQTLTQHFSIVSFTFFIFSPQNISLHACRQSLHKLASCIYQSGCICSRWLSACDGKTQQHSLFYVHSLCDRMFIMAGKTLIQFYYHCPQFCPCFLHVFISTVAR